MNPFEREKEEDNAAAATLALFACHCSTLLILLLPLCPLALAIAAALQHHTTRSCWALLDLSFRQLCCLIKMCVCVCFKQTDQQTLPDRQTDISLSTEPFLVSCLKKNCVFASEKKKSFTFTLSFLGLDSDDYFLFSFFLLPSSFFFVLVESACPSIGSPLPHHPHSSLLAIVASNGVTLGRLWW